MTHPSVDADRLSLREPHPAGQDAFTVRVRFPTHREPMCRLRVEITRDELLLVDPRVRMLLHGFPETSPEATLDCYALEEVVAKKLRALLQSHLRLQSRGWGASRVCRDYYDLWQLFRSAELDCEQLPDLVRRKCAHRGIHMSAPQAFFADDLRRVAEREWQQQLCPFVRDCPGIDQVLWETEEKILALAW